MNKCRKCSTLIPWAEWSRFTWHGVGHLCIRCFVRCDFDARLRGFVLAAALTEARRRELLGFIDKGAP